MSPPSLVSICMRTGIRNINYLTDVGDFEYWKIQPLLKHVKSPDQLREIELNSPQIKGEDAELWKVFIAKVDPQWHLKNYVPRNPEKWYEIYRKYKREAEQKLKQDEENLRNAMLGLNKEKASHTSVIIDAKHLPRLPRDPRMRPNNGGVPIGKGSTNHQKSKNNSVLTWGIGSRTKTSDSKSVLLRAKREAREMSMRGKLGVPQNKLKSRTVISQAPPSMIDGYRRAANAPLKIHKPTTSSSVNASSSNTDTAQEAKERRLRALTLGRAGQSGIARQQNTEDGDTGSEERTARKAPAGTVQATMVSDDEESDLDDMFDEKPSPPKKPASQPPPRQPQYSQKSSSLKPSDVISSLVSGSKRPAASSTSTTKAREISRPVTPQGRPTVAAKPATPGVRPAGSAAAPGAGKPLVRKRAEVDVFNRQAKKPRRA